MQIFLFNISSTLWSENYLETNLTGKCYSEDIISFAEVIIPRIVLVYGVLSSDGDTEAAFLVNFLLQSRGQEITWRSR